jgi:hypothetical protein
MKRTGGGRYDERFRGEGPLCVQQGLTAGPLRKQDPWQVRVDGGHKSGSEVASVPPCSHRKQDFDTCWNGGFSQSAC